MSFAQTKTKTHVRIYFDNYLDGNFIALDKALAKNLLELRKNQNGYVDRRVYLRIYVSFSSKLTPFSRFDEQKALTAHIHWIEVYGNQNYFSDDIGIIDLRKSKH